MKFKSIETEARLHLHSLGDRGKGAESDKMLVLQGTRTWPRLLVSEGLELISSTKGRDRTVIWDKSRHLVSPPSHTQFQSLEMRY